MKIKIFSSRNHLISLNKKFQRNFFVIFYFLGLPKMLFYKKRSESDVQLNWIFVLIAGAVFLFIVFKAVSLQRESASTSASVGMKSNFEAAVAGSMTQEDFSGEIDVGKTGINFSCGQAVFKGISPADLGAAFAPGGISSDSGKVIIKAAQWKFPLKAGNLLYLTSPKNSYLLAKNNAQSAVVDEADKRMPDSVDKAIISADNVDELAAEISGRKGKDIRLVFFGKEEAKNHFNLLNNASIIEIEPKIGAALNYGNVTFYNKDRSSNSTYYFGDEMMVAAIYSGSIADYECSAAKAFDRLYWILNMSQIRLVKMAEEYSSSSSQECYNLLSSSDSNSATFSILEFMALIYPLTKNRGLAGISDKNAKKIADSENSLDSANSLLVRFSCPSIY